MCGEIAVRRVPKDVLERFGLVEAVSTLDESGASEVRFAFRDKRPRLPLIYDGEYTVAEWGNRDNKLSRLPKTGWCRLDSFQSGKWKRLRPEPVTIPADYGREKGFWFPIREGIEGVLVQDEQGNPHCYMLTTDASPEFLSKTGHDRMPVLIDQVI